MAIQGPKVIRDFPFLVWSLTFPEAIPFPRDPYAAELDTHRHIFDAHKEQMLEALADAGESVEPNIALSDLGVVIEVKEGKPTRLEVGSRGELAAYLGSYRGLVHPVLRKPIWPRAYVAIATENVVSLHLALVTGTGTDEVGMVRESELAFEPLAITHRQDTTLHVTAWDTPDGDTRYAWAVAPAEPKTDDEALDRFLARDERLIREAIAEFRAKNPGKWPLVFGWCSREMGDALQVKEKKSFDMFEVFLRNIVRTVKKNTMPGVVAVIVMMDGKLFGLRWLPMEPGDDRALPPSLIEKAIRPPDEYARPFFGTMPKPEVELPKPKKKHDPEKAIRYVLEQLPIDDEIEMHLSQMTKEEIDADMRLAGFDPVVEHATRWIRGEVIAAMYELERDETRFFNEDGHLRTRPDDHVKKTERS